MTFSENVLDQSDANGHNSRTFAHAIVNLHSVSTADFLGEYGDLQGERVDAGELLVWLGY
jgi:hypothetical protein